MDMREKIINRMEEIKLVSSVRFTNKTYFGELMNDIDIYNIDEDKLLGLFEQMVRLHYAQL